MVLGLQELSNWSLNEIQFILYNYFGYDTFNKEWFQHWCENIGHKSNIDYNITREEIQYNCERCGKRYL